MRLIQKKTKNSKLLLVLDLKSKGKGIADLVRDAGENSMILVDGTHTITKTIKMQKGQSLVGKNYLEGEKDADLPS